MGHCEPFNGVIGRTVEESIPSWREPVLPAPSAPNVVLLVFDDVGFAHLGCYGSGVQTPVTDALAAGGLRYTNFHVTPTCSPTRAALLTGRNPHSVGMRMVAEDSGFPHLRGALPADAATLAEMLRTHGYATFIAGKWHLTPVHETTSAGPYHSWPLQRGFDRFYGFLGGETDQFYPELVCGNEYVDPPGTPEDGYHLTEDLVDRGISYIRELKSLTPERPFFLYLPLGATHAPHQAPRAFLDKYRGRFDHGWDVERHRVFRRQGELGIVPDRALLAPRNPGVRPWSELSNDERRFAARLQEAFAAFLDHADSCVGRLIEYLRDTGELDNTLFLVLSDNGASQEGGETGLLAEMKYFAGFTEDAASAVGRLEDIGTERSHSNYPWGWAMAGNTPLRWYKQNTHGGGVRVPLIVHWPAGITDYGANRDQFCYVTDIVPTVLDILGAEPPGELNGVLQQTLHGTSLQPSFAAGHTTRRTRTQYFEMLGHRGLYHAGWKAVTRHDEGTDFESDRWELYHLDTDFSETKDLAAEHPAKLRELAERWWAEAGRFGVQPLDDRHRLRSYGYPRFRGVVTSRREYVYRPPLPHIPVAGCPPHGIGGFTIVAHADITGGLVEGVLLNRGSASGGYAFFAKYGRLIFDYNFYGTHTRFTAAMPTSPGRYELAVSISPIQGGGANGRLEINGEEAVDGRIPQLSPVLSSLGMDIGRCLAPVVDDYRRPFGFTGALRMLTITLDSDPTVRSHAAAVEAAALRRTE